MSAEERPRAGACSTNAQAARSRRCFNRVAKRSKRAALEARLAEESARFHPSGRGRRRGGIHPVIRTWQRVEAIFRSVGFDVAMARRLKPTGHNFTALNQPANHPARSMHDTFYVDGGLLLRTHTSPMQVRYARTHKPPIKVISPGRTYRVDSDATHSPMFHQVEGLWLDENVSFADLKGVYTDFLRAFFRDRRTAGAASVRHFFRLRSPPPKSTWRLPPDRTRDDGWNFQARARCIRSNTQFRA